MGGTVQTSSSTTAPTNPDVQPTVSTLMKGLQGAYNSGVAVNNQSLYPGVGDTTKNSWATTLGAANNPAYSSAIGGAISDFGDVAAGNRFGMNDPGYAQLRAKVGDDTLTDVNSMFTGSGRFGSGSHVKNATSELGNVYAGMDYNNYQQDIARQQQAAGMMPGLFQASLAPGMTQGAVGAAQDADALATRQADNDLFRRQNDAKWEALARGSSILSGTAGAGGSSTSQEIPWWAAAAGLGSTLAGGFM
jgi:hypothetical protein